MHARFGLAPLHGALLLVFAGSIAERREAPVEPVWDGSNIYTITVNATLIFLFLSFTVPIVAGYFAIGTAFDRLESK